MTFGERYVLRKIRSSEWCMPPAKAQKLIVEIDEMVAEAKKEAFFAGVELGRREAAIIKKGEYLKEFLDSCRPIH